MTVLGILVFVAVARVGLLTVFPGRPRPERFPPPVLDESRET